MLYVCYLKIFGTLLLVGIVEQNVKRLSNLPRVFLLIFELRLLPIQNDTCNFKATKKMKSNLSLPLLEAAAVTSHMYLSSDTYNLGNTYELYFFLFLPTIDIYCGHGSVSGIYCQHGSASNWEIVSYCAYVKVCLFKQINSIPLYTLFMDIDVSFDMTNNASVSTLAHISFCTCFGTSCLILSTLPFITR